MQINPALLIIDLQNDFIKNENSPVFIPSGKNIVQSIINIRELFALKKLFIFNIITVHSTNKNEWGKKDIELSRSYCIETTKGAEIIDELLPLKNNEIIIKKKFYSAFFETDLLEKLKEYKITDLYFTGLTTGCCVSSTARDAYNYKFNLFFVKDALTATSLTAHEYELAFFQKSLGAVIDSAEIINYF